MNEKLQYASMLEIPVNTCNITYKPIKKKRVRGRKKVDGEQIKRELMEKVNVSVDLEKTEMPENQEQVESEISPLENTFLLNDEIVEEQAVEVKKVKAKRSPLIICQIAVICVLLATIIVSNVVNVNSGLTAFFRGVFSNNATTMAVDERVYSEFTPVINITGATEQADGVMNFVGEGNVYSSCDGKVSSIVMAEDGSYTMEITHSENFVSVFKGLTYAYASEGDKVFSNIPVGYYTEQLQMCFCGTDGAVISDYQIVDGCVVWAV